MSDASVPAERVIPAQPNSAILICQMPAPDNQPDEDRAELYRQSAGTLRQLAAEVRFDFGRRQQLVTLADAFERLADRLDGLPLSRAAD